MGSLGETEAFTPRKRPVHVSTTVTSVHLYEAIEETARKRSMRFGLMGGRDQVELTTGEVFGSALRGLVERSREEMAAELLVYERRDDQELGLLYYIPAFDTNEGKTPSSLSFEIAVGLDAFDTLWQLGLRKSAPSGFRFGINGMSYAAAPDGRTKRWDIEAEGKQLSITEINWHLDVHDLLRR